MIVNEISTNENISLVEKRTFLGSNDAVITALYFKFHEKLVSNCNDGKIRIWNFRTGECIQVIDMLKDVSHFRGACHMIKWEDDILLVCSPNWIQSFHVNEPFDSHPTKKLIRISVDYESSEPLLKLDDDKFVVFEEYTEFTLFSYSQQRIIKSLLDEYYVEEWNDGPFKLLHSKNHKGCFYFDADENNAPIYLFSYEEDEIRKKFELEGWVCDYDIFNNTSGDEILIAVDSGIVFHNTNTGISKRYDDKKSYITRNHLNCFTVIENRYVIGGSRMSENKKVVVSVYPLFGDQLRIGEKERCRKEDIHNMSIRNIETIKEPGNLFFVTSSTDKIVKLIEVEGFYFNQWKLDVEERTKFVNSNTIECDISSFTIKIQNVIIIDFVKLLLLEM